MGDSDKPSKVAPVLSAFGAFQRRRGIHPTTIVRRRRLLRRFDRWVGPPGLLRAGPAHVDEFASLGDVTPQTRGWTISNLAAFYAWAADEGHVSADPTRRVPRPRLPRRVPRPLATEDFERAFAEAGTRMRAWLALMAFMGLRCQEVAGLRTDDLLTDSDPPTLIVSAAKGGRERVLPLNPVAGAALEAVRPTRPGWMFPSASAAAVSVTPSYVSRSVNEYLRGLGISGTAHQLRHLFATEVYRRSRDLRVTQELLGHSSPSTTAVYTAFAPAVAADVVMGLGGKAPRLRIGRV